MTESFDRSKTLQAISERGSDPWDLLIIGGGATGVGVALDAATRGLDTVLLERGDFGIGTSSRSTKLVHGGVRYLRQGNITLVRDALRERALLRINAPHLVSDQPFLIPCESRLKQWYYGFGLKMYDLLASGDQFGRSRMLNQQMARELGQGIKAERLAGGVIYHDGQFDDSRLLIDMARLAAAKGAHLVNHCEVEQILHGASGQVEGAAALDRLQEQRLAINARVVVNAAGPFCDSVRQLDQPDVQPMVASSQGVHLVFDRSFYPADVAMMVPETDDGRVIFVVPWHDHVIVGTTDTAIKQPVIEPKAQSVEIDFLLETVSRYLEKTPTQDDILSVFAGIRPLVKGDPSARTASLSRDHVIRASDSGMLTITGGKWTTVRKMAEDCVDHVLKQAGQEKRACVTKTLSIPPPDQTLIEQIEADDPSLAETLHPDLDLTGSRVAWATRYEMAMCVQDLLARRHRALFLNARATQAVAPRVAEIMAVELGRDQQWQAQQVSEMESLTIRYLPGD